MTTLTIYNSIGHQVATLVNEYLESGVHHRMVFDASHLAASMYVVRLTNHEFAMTRKTVLLK